MFSPAAFFSALRPILGPLTQDQVDGFNLLLAEATKRGTPTNYFADILATVWWETGKTMQPVREAFYVGDFQKAEAWRKRNLRYWPYYGRGYVQLTWDYNYRKVTEYFNRVLGLQADFVAHPDDVMFTKWAVIILFEGMKQGWFTTKKLSDYIDDKDESDSEDLREFIEARRIINGTDKAETIGKIALNFEHALRGANWEEGAVVTPTTPTPKPTVPKPKGREPMAPRGLIAFVVELFAKLFGKKG